MKKQPGRKLSLEELISELADDPADVKPLKKMSLKEAIIELRPKIGSKVFTKRELMRIIETAFPELAPVAMPNLDASLSRAKEHVEIVKTGGQNIYRYKQPK